MSTRRIRLRVITDRDSVFLYELMTSPQAGGRVRFAGATPSPDKIAASLWDSVLAQFVIEGLNSQKPLGLVAITSANFRDGFAYISALGHSRRGRFERSTWKPRKRVTLHSRVVSADFLLKKDD